MGTDGSGGMWIGILVFGACALAGAVITVVLAVRARGFLASARRVQGRITGAERSTSRRRGGHGRSTTFRPVFSYTDPDDGQEYEKVSPSGRPRPLDAGPAEVLIPPDRPEEARLNRFGSIWLSTLIMGIITVPFLAVTLILVGVTAAG